MHANLLSQRKSKTIYIARTKSENDTGFDSYSVPFFSSCSRKQTNRAILEFKETFPKSKMRWFIAERYVEVKDEMKAILEQIK